MNKKLRLSNKKFVAGVCGGFAEYFAIDSILVRIFWGGLIFYDRAYFFVSFYIICWSILPVHE